MSEELDLTRYGDKERKDWFCISNIWDDDGKPAFVIEEGSDTDIFDCNLVNDAPLLLAEVIRLREITSRRCSGCKNLVHQKCPDGPIGYVCTVLNECVDPACWFCAGWKARGI